MKLYPTRRSNNHLTHKHLESFSKRLYESMKNSVSETSFYRIIRIYDKHVYTMIRKFHFPDQFNMYDIYTSITFILYNYIRHVLCDSKISGDEFSKIDKMLNIYIVKVMKELDQYFGDYEYIKELRFKDFKERYKDSTSADWQTFIIACDMVIETLHYIRGRELDRKDSMVDPDQLARTRLKEYRQR